MNQMMYSGMIGEGSPYSGERMAGSFVNTASSIASPLAMGGMALAGLDPFSMAMKGGAAGFAAGGLGGAAVGALGGAAAVGVPLMAAGYAGGQFMQGAQQHQQLGANLRSSFGFRNQFGGTGFTGGEVGQIGSAMRDMTTQLGPGGEQVSFDELGRLASNMGRMGMAQGVRNAKEFTDKFKQMVTSLKEIASEFGTSLEGPEDDGRHEAVGRLRDEQPVPLRQHDQERSSGRRHGHDRAHGHDVGRFPDFPHGGR